MNRSMLRLLIVKDLYLYRGLMALAIGGGIVSLLLGGLETPGFGLGLIVFITSLVALGIFIVMYGVLRERQEKSLLFVMSLPVSPMQYTMAKVVSALIAFLIPWLIMLAASVFLQATTEGFGGRIPGTVGIMGFFLTNFCVLLAVLLVTGSERWAVASIVLTNMSVSVYFIVIGRLSGIAAYADSPVAVWNSTIFTLLAIEAAVTVLAIGLTFFLQSRKRDFL
jgi:ABC-2 type transport system permease protein